MFFSLEIKPRGWPAWEADVISAVQRELRHKSLGFGGVSSNCDAVYRQGMRREGEEAGEGESMPCSARGGGE